jgi:hypothetical protein
MRHRDFSFAFNADMMKKALLWDIVPARRERYFLPAQFA